MLVLLVLVLLVLVSLVLLTAVAVAVLTLASPVQVLDLAVVLDLAAVAALVHAFAAWALESAACSLVVDAEHEALAVAATK